MALVQTPALGWFLTEPVRGALTFSTLPFAARRLLNAPAGDGHSVLVLPGLLADDLSTGTLRAYLTRLGYRACGWGLGRNLGPTDAVITGMPKLLGVLATNGPVSIIGWSLGGVYARELARDHPAIVRQVITLGSPFAMVDTRQSRADGAFRRRSKLHVDPARLPSRERMRQPVPVPSTAIYSRTDGIVDWHACVDPADATHQNIEVRCGHLGFGVDAATLWAIADRLALPIHQHSTPFQPPAWFPR